MKAIKGGVDRVVHVNQSKRDSYTAKVSSKPQPYPVHTPLQPKAWDLSGDAKNCIPGTSIGERVTPRRSQSRNQ